MDDDWDEFSIYEEHVEMSEADLKILNKKVEEVEKLVNFTISAFGSSSSSDSIISMYSTSCFLNEDA